MDVEFLPFRAEHLALVDLPDGVERLPSAVAAELEDPELAWSAFARGVLLGCGGVARETPFRGHGWIIRRADVPRRAWPAITAYARAVLERAHELGLHRIGAFVDIRFGGALIWARKLGFEPDGIARAYLRDRTDAVVYSRIAA